MSLWFDETIRDEARFGLKVTRTLASERSRYQQVDVFETRAFGRVLALDGMTMTSEADEHYYHEMIVHPALCTVRAPERVLIIGGGDGGTAREVLAYPEVREVVLCEIDEVVVRLCKEFFPGHGRWDDERLDVIIGDGIEYARNAADNSFDVVILDGSDPVGPAAGLFDADFYASVHRITKPSGAFVLQSESPVLMEGVFLEIQRALRGKFSSVRPYLGHVPIYPGGAWSWTYASDEVDPLAILRERANRVSATTKLYNVELHLGAFALPNHLRRRLEL